MRHLVFLLAMTITFSGVAQSEYPYNPDENNDGYIGLVDLLGLLTLFGSDFTPEELSFNDDAAMLDLGPMYFGRCVVECSRLEGDWKVSDIEGIGAFEEELLPNTWYWVESIENGGVGGSSTYRLPAIMNTSFQTALVNEDIDSRRCACLTRAYPEVEYQCLSVPFNEFATAAQELIDQGYKPAGGPSPRTGSSSCFGCFWRVHE